MPYSPKCIDFAPILQYTYLVDPVSLKLLAAGAKFFGFIVNFEFLLHSSAYFPPPSITQIGLEPGPHPPPPPRPIHPWVIHCIKNMPFKWFLWIPLWNIMLPTMFSFYFILPKLSIGKIVIKVNVFLKTQERANAPPKGVGGCEEPWLGRWHYILYSGRWIKWAADASQRLDWAAQIAWSLALLLYLLTPPVFKFGSKFMLIFRKYSSQKCICYYYTRKVYTHKIHVFNVRTSL